MKFCFDRQELVLFDGLVGFKDLLKRNLESIFVYLFIGFHSHKFLMLNLLFLLNYLHFLFNISHSHIFPLDADYPSLVSSFCNLFTFENVKIKQL